MCSEQGASSGGEVKDVERSGLIAEGKAEVIKQLGYNRWMEGVVEIQDTRRAG